MKCCYAIFWMYGSKNILLMFPLFKKRKSHKFSNFSAKVIISGQKYCRHLMQDSAQFGYDWTKNKEMHPQPI